jgi:hypothetical protein
MTTRERTNPLQARWIFRLSYGIKRTHVVLKLCVDSPDTLEQDNAIKTLGTGHGIATF